MPKTAKLKMQLDTMNVHTVSQSLLIRSVPGKTQTRHYAQTIYLNWYRLRIICGGIWTTLTSVCRALVNYTVYGRPAMSRDSESSLQFSTVLCLSSFPGTKFFDVGEPRYSKFCLNTWIRPERVTPYTRVQTSNSP